MTPPVALTIAGSDPSAGAGIQADLKTFAAQGVYGVSVLTAVTVQNSRGVSYVHPLPPDLVAAQLFAVLEDLPVAAVKVGMLATEEIAEAVAAVGYALPNLVLDPVLVSSSGHRLTAVGAIRRLLPYATVVTPNADEARYVTDAPQWTVVTGSDGAADTVHGPDGTWELRAEPVRTRNTHGTGCTFSAAIAARLALGDTVPYALDHAKRYVTRALRAAAGWQLGAGTGPLNHFSEGEDR
jgi:hydroxymethylpyrimidine/phosphomethylpyrimidine kinase